MRHSKILKYYSRYKFRRRLLTFGILLTAWIICLVGLASFYVKYTGTFTIALEEKDDAILSISTSRDFLYPTTRLTPLARKSSWPISYESIDIDSVLQTDGDSNIDGNYLAYTFYLKNMGDNTANVESIIRLDGRILNLHKCTRFMLIEDDEIVGIFRHYDEIDVKEDKTPREYYRFAESDDIIYRFRIPYLQPKEVVKYSIVIWIDGWDADCTDDKKGGSVNYSMWFSVSSIYKQES